MKIFIPLFIVLFLLSCNENAKVNKTTPPLSKKKLSLCSNGTGVPIKQIDKLPTPKIRTKIGNSHFLITTKNEEGQIWFDQGLNLLHGFWHIEAYRAFKEVIRLDSTCAMGYWGLAMCQPGFAGEDITIWKNAIEKARIVNPNITPMEARLLETSFTLIMDGPEMALPAFRKLARDFGNNPEIISWAAIMMRQSPSADLSILKEVELMLEKSLKQFPDYMSLLHYYIHIMELGLDYQKAKPAAEKLLQLFPNSPHLVHMPGHLYFLEGDYEKAVKVFEKAKLLEETYHQSEKISFAINQNYLHNLHYLTVAYTELGDYEKAMEVAQKYATIEFINALKAQYANDLMILYEGRMLPVFVNIRFRKWDEANKILTKLLHHFDLPPNNFFTKTYLKAMSAYCKGMEKIENEDATVALKYATEMTQLLDQFNEKGVNYNKSMETILLNETYDILEMQRLELFGWIDNIDSNTPFHAAAFIEAIKLEEAIGYDEPPRLLYPIGESIGQLYLKRGELDRANNAFSIALKKRPNSWMIKSYLPN